jgi:mono/diheme cytochrome c family protein
LEHGKELAGSELQGWRAYNITADAEHGIGGWSDMEIAAYLKSGYASGRGSASGPMGEAVEHSLQYLTDEDVGSLVAYLRSVPAREGHEPISVDPKPAAMVASSDAAPGADTTPSQGRRLFEGACASCHQWNGIGQQTPYASLAGTRGVNDVGGANVTQAILRGVNMRVAGNDVFMPAFGEAYSDTEVSALANYVIAHFGGKQGTVTPAEVAKRRSL